MPEKDKLKKLVAKYYNAFPDEITHKERLLVTQTLVAAWYNGDILLVDETDEKDHESTKITDPLAGRIGYAGITGKKQAPVYRDFDWALRRLKNELYDGTGGGPVRRRGWNGKGMAVFLQKGYPEGIPINKNTAEATGRPEGTLMCFDPYLMIRTADGTLVPWTPSQSDILADDWEPA